MAIYDKTGNEVSAAFAANGTEAAKAYDAGGVQVHSNVHTLKVMTYNVGSWYDGMHDIVPAEKDLIYYALQTGIISKYAPDVLIMNEYTKQFSYGGRSANSVLLELGFEYIYETDGDSPTVTRGRCVASKFPISDYTIRSFDDGGYYFDSCTIKVNGFQINVIITHLYWGDNLAKRTAEIQKILTLLSGYSRFVLAGDFNTIDCYDKTGEDYVAIIQPLINAGYNVANCGDFGFITTYYDEPTHGNWTGVLDNIVTSSNIEILDVRRDETKLDDSLEDHIDHLPLIATLQIN